jgi:hypothetical protein
VNTSGKICSICRTENVYTASVCRNCGAVLDDNPTNIVAMPENFSGQPNTPIQNVESFIDMALVPEEGVGIYVAGAFKPYYLYIYKELIIGRQTDAPLESVLDLSDLDALNMGISRRHAMIRKTATGYEVVDLASRNGTWLNAERLVPHRPYPFPSGSQLRIGQMRLLVVYRSFSNDAKNS